MCFTSSLSLIFKRGARFLSNAEVTALVECRGILGYRLETVLESPERGVAIRREMLSPKLPDSSALEKLPYKHYDYSKVLLMIGCRAALEIQSHMCDDAVFKCRFLVLR